LPGARQQRTTPVATDTNRTTKYAQGGTALSLQTAQWATPQAHDAALGNPARVGRFGTSAGGRNLTDEASLWMTPNVPNGGRSATHAEMKGRTATHNGVKVQIGLEYQAKTWPSPTTRMHKGGGEAVNRADGKSRLDMLDWAEEAWSPSTAPAPTTPVGSTLSPSAQTLRLQLNASFAEWLMGMPPEWTGYGPSETEFIRWQSLMRGELSTLCSRPALTTLL